MTKKLFDIVEQDLSILEDELLSITKSPVERITHIGRHLTEAGGKRLRPALYLICAKSRPNHEAANISMAAAIELIHMATLVHDDVIDDASTRRGRPTANACWGNHASVLAGDYLFAKSFSIIADGVNTRKLKLLADVICSMCEGEIIQNQGSYDPEETEASYLKRIAKKTADFIAVSCELGAMDAALSAEDIQALREYGNSIGLAFQITDDILDVTQSSEQLGKPAGNDLRQGIVTLPVIYALANSADKEELRQIVTEQDMSDEQVQRGIEIIQACGAVDFCYDRVDHYLTAARQGLPACLPDEIRTTLIHIADFIGQRNY